MHEGGSLARKHHHILQSDLASTRMAMALQALDCKLPSFWLQRLKFVSVMLVPWYILNTKWRLYLLFQTTIVKVIMIKLIGLLLGFFVANSVMADEGDYRCLKSVGLKSSIKLQFVFPPDNKDIGKVIYKGGSGSIKVQMLKQKETRKGPSGRPSEFESQWSEINSDGPGGTYIIVTQGAQIYDFKYVRNKDGKIFRFEEDVDAFADNGCEWGAK